MADADPAPEVIPTAMNVSTPGKDASDPDQTTARKALFQSTPKASDKSENVSTPSTGEKRNTRENHIVIPRGCDPNMKPEQVTSLLVKTIEGELVLTERLKIKPLEMPSAAIVKITSESLEGIHLSRHKELVFLKEGLQNMVAMLIVPKSACIGVLAAQLAVYYTIYLRVQRTTKKEAWSTRSDWMKEVTELFKNGTETEFEMSYERSVDRHKDKMTHCADAMAIGLASWALPNVINAFITVLRWTPNNSSEEGQNLDKFQNQVRTALAKFGISGPEKDDGWVVYPSDGDTVLTAKGLELLRVPAGTKIELKKLVSTGELQSSVDVYIAPQSGVFNIKRGFRDGGEGCEAVITELGDDVQLVIPRIEPDTEATGLLKLTLRIKLTAEKEIEKKLLKLCKDPRNDAAEVKGIHTKLDSGAEVRMIWSGDLGTARARNGLNRVAAISAEVHGKNSEEVKKLKGDLEKQIKANADALLEQDTKLTTYTAHYTAMIDKQATQTTDMQKAHGEALAELHAQMKESETKHSEMMESMRVKHATEMDDVRGVLYEERVAHKCEMDEVREVLKETQQRQLGFAAQAEELTRNLASFMKAAEFQMLATKEDVRMLKELKGDAGYADAAASALAEQQAALRSRLAHLHMQVTAFVTAVHTGPREEARDDVDSSTGSGLVNRQDAGVLALGCELIEGEVEQRLDCGHSGKPSGAHSDERSLEALRRAWMAWSGLVTLGDRGARGRRRTAKPVAHGAEADSALQREGASGLKGEAQQSRAECEHIRMPSIIGAARNGHKGMLCGTKGILVADAFLSSKTSTPTAAQAHTDRLELCRARRAGQHKFEFGGLRNSAGTRCFHAVRAAILLLLSCGKSQASSVRCCTTMELRRVDWGSPRCYDTGTLRCYDGATISNLAIDRGGWKTHETARCADTGLEFWGCVEAIKTAAIIAPSPTYDENLAAAKSEVLRTF